MPFTVMPSNLRLVFTPRACRGASLSATSANGSDPSVRASISYPPPLLWSRGVPVMTGPFLMVLGLRDVDPFGGAGLARPAPEITAG